MCRRSLVIGVLLLLGLLARPGNAESTTVLSVEAIDFGNFRSDGYHLETDPNYLAGRSSSEPTDRNFFLFDLAAIQGEVISAKLRAWNPSSGYSGAGQETYQLYDVSTVNLPKLRTSWAAGTDIFDDLGSGQPYGSTSVTAAHNNNWVEVPLAPMAVSAMNDTLKSGQSSKLFAAGGAITSLFPDGWKLDGYAGEYIFANTNNPPSASFSPQLVVTFQTPEPGMIVHLGALGLFGLVLGWRRWRMKRG